MITTATVTAAQVETPFPEFAAPRVWAWMENFRNRVCDDYSPQTLSEFLALWSARASLEQRWAVYRDGELGGLITLQPLGPSVLTSHVLFKRSFWGSDTTMQAMRQVYDVAFDLPHIRKIWSLVFADNAQIIGLAKRMGFEIEGRMRHHTMRHGQPADMIALGLLREDFYNAMGSSNPAD